ncbi:hypothetical protein [Bradyrhizobium sp. USDA 4486]
MPDLPLPLQHDVEIQNDKTGQVGYLKFIGDTLVDSALFDYGLGPNFKIVASDSINADGTPDLVAQNQTTGQLDFLFLDANANLIGSALGAVVPDIVGVGFDFGTVPGQAGHTMVSQLPNGQLDFLAFDQSAHLIASDLIANTAGLPFAVGVAAGSNSAQAVLGVGDQDAVVTQLPNGAVDFIGFTGSFGQSLAYTASFLAPGSAGTPPIGAINQNIGFNFNEVNPGNATEAIHALAQLPGGRLDAIFFDSGKNDPTHTGFEYASTQFHSTFPGWHLVDAGLVSHQDLFLIS